MNSGSGLEILIQPFLSFEEVFVGLEYFPGETENSKLELDPGQQLPPIEGFADVVYPADLQTLDLFFRIVQGGEEDNGDVPRPLISF